MTRPFEQMHFEIDRNSVSPSVYTPANGSNISASPESPDVLLLRHIMFASFIFFSNWSCRTTHLSSRAVSLHSSYISQMQPRTRARTCAPARTTVTTRTPARRAQNSNFEKNTRRSVSPEKKISRKYQYLWHQSCAINYRSHALWQILKNCQ